MARMVRLKIKILFCISALRKQNSLQRVIFLEYSYVQKIDLISNSFYSLKFESFDTLFNI